MTPKKWIAARIEAVALKFDEQAEVHAKLKDFEAVSVWANRATGARAVALALLGNER